MKRSLKRIALVVTIGTLISKTGGLARQLVIAGAFGVGTAYDAYNYAYVLPGFFLILLGGINGPFHNAMVSVLSRQPKKEAAHILASISTILGTGLSVITTILIIGANPLIKIVGPGLSPEVHNLAVTQLQIMAPIALIAGLIGLGFGSLNAKDEFLIPAISPLISSLVIMIFVGIFWIQRSGINDVEALPYRGGIVLAIATLSGAFLQWLIQQPALIRQSLSKMRLIWDWKHTAVKEVFRIIAPATLSSGMLQINVFTDLFFASGILSAAAGLSYANFLIQAPLGLISSALLIPLLPTFSKLTGNENRQTLISRIRQGLMLSSASMVALGALFIALANPIVGLIYERGAFDENAVSLVAGLLIAYGFGMPAYLARDVLVRVFYALGDGTTPFRFSALGIGLNVFFDWAFVGGPTPWGHQLPFNLGAPGLVLATVVVNLFTCIALLLRLQIRLGQLPLKDWGLDLSKLVLSGFVAGIIAWTIQSGEIWPSGFLGLLMEVSISASISLFVYCFIGNSLGIKEIEEIIMICRKKIFVSLK